MKSLVNILNESLTKKIKDGSDLLSVVHKNIVKLFGRGSKKYIDVQSVDKDYEVYKKDIDKLTVYKSSYGNIDEVSMKTMLLILAQVQYFGDYKLIESQIRDIVQKYSSSDIKKVSVIDLENRYVDLTGYLNIEIKFNNNAYISAQLYLDGFEAKQYKTIGVHMGVNIYHDEYDGVDDTWIERSLVELQKVDLR